MLLLKSQYNYVKTNYFKHAFNSTLLSKNYYLLFLTVCQLADKNSIFRLIFCNFYRQKLRKSAGRSTAFLIY